MSQPSNLCCFFLSIFTPSYLLRRSPLSLPLFVTILSPPFSPVSLLLRRAVSIVLLLRLSPPPSFFSFASSQSVFSSAALSLWRIPPSLSLAPSRRSLSSDHLLRRSLSAVGLLLRSQSVVFSPPPSLLKFSSVALPLILECPSLQRKNQGTPPPPKKNPII